MVELSIVISTIVEAGFRLVKSLVNGKDDRKTHYEAMPFGTDSVPIKNLRAVVVQTTTKEERVVLGYINKDQQAAAGEHRIYSMDSGGLVATYLWLKADGTIEIGGNADTAVKFSELKTAFDQLKADHDALVAAHNANMADINAFASAYVPGGPAVQGLPAIFVFGNDQEGNSSADIDPAEEPNIKLGN